MYGSGLGMVRDHPILGLGPGLVQPAYAGYRIDRCAGEKIPHLHNNVVQIAAERGIAGLLDLPGDPRTVFGSSCRASPAQIASPVTRPAGRRLL